VSTESVAAHIEISLSQQVAMVLILLLTSKGMAGVPRASLVVVAGTLAQFNIPEAGLLLLLGIDHFLDMGRSATNVIGNTIAAAIVSRWEGESCDPTVAVRSNSSLGTLTGHIADNKTLG
jgi:Na+/H+-dicarboxylate symporter